MSCRIDQSLCKTAAEVKLKGWDYTGFLAKVWTASTIYLTDEVVRPKRANGFQYRASSDGQSGPSAPNFTARDGALVADGTVVWVAEAIDNASLRATIAASVWTASDTSVTISDESVDSTGGRQRTSANIGGGAAGETYTVINTVTMSDNTIEEMGIELEIAA